MVAVQTVEGGEAGVVGLVGGCVIVDVEVRGVRPGVADGRLAADALQPWAQTPVLGRRGPIAGR